MSHLTYHIQIQGIDYTFRVIGKDGNLFVDRNIEKKNLDIIRPLGLNNETVYFDTETGEKAAKYVEGTVLTQLDYKPYLPMVSNALKTLHHSSLKPASDYGLIDRLNLYETFTNIKSPLYLELKEAWMTLYHEEHQDKPKVFCHNDAQRSNMVVSGDRLYLLDWEYAGLNEFYYDIASFGNVDFNDALALLDVYLGRKATKNEQDSVRFYRMFQALQWHQVALRKDMIGLSEVLHFDFKMLSEKYLNLAHTLYQQIKG
jgi:thiamine kinase-like enzyme